MFALVEEQLFTLVMLHFNTLVPRARPVTSLVGLLEFVNTPLPLTTLQLPLPVVGVLAAKVVLGLLIHTVWFGPATALLVAGCTSILMVALVDEQVFTLVMLHCSTLIPRPSVALEVALLELLNTALPLTTLQLPKPVVGVLAAKVVVGLLIHKV